MTNSQPRSPCRAACSQAASAAVWFAVAQCWQRGDDPITWVPRDRCPWKPFAVGLALPVSIVVQTIVVTSSAISNPTEIDSLRLTCQAIALEIVVLMGLLAIGTPIRASDLDRKSTRLNSSHRT